MPGSRDFFIELLLPFGKLRSRFFEIVRKLSVLRKLLREFSQVFLSLLCQFLGLSKISVFQLVSDLPGEFRIDRRYRLLTLLSVRAGSQLFDLLTDFLLTLGERSRGLLSLLGVFFQRLSKQFLRLCNFACPLCQIGQFFELMITCGFKQFGPLLHEVFQSGHQLRLLLHQQLLVLGEFLPSILKVGRRSSVQRFRIWCRGVSRFGSGEFITLLLKLSGIVCQLTGPLRDPV